MFEIKKDGRDFYSMVYEIVKNAKKINGEYKNSEGQLIGFVHGSLDMEFMGFLYKEGITEKDYFYLGESLIVKFDALLEELKKGPVFFEDTQMTKKEMQHFIDYIDIKTVIDKYMKRELNQLKEEGLF